MNFNNQLQQQQQSNFSDYFIIFVLCDTGELEIPTVCNSLRNAQYFVNNFKNKDHHVQIWISEGKFNQEHQDVPGTCYTF
jgi:hypothetical protein